VYCIQNERVNKESIGIP